MTEDEAGKKICPIGAIGALLLLLTMATTQVNPMENVRQLDDARRCNASDCMMWRWNIDEGDGRHGTRGFCGIGGK
jgi:hypothetical protein